MRFRSLLGWGIVIYAVQNLVWSGIVMYGIAANPLARVLSILTLIVVCAVATRSLRFTNERDVFAYAMGWVIVVAILDAIFVVPVSGWAIYSNWNLWVGYILLLFIPMIISLVTKRRAQSLS